MGIGIGRVRMRRVVWGVGGWRRGGIGGRVMF